jgi:nesprin-1
MTEEWEQCEKKLKDVKSWLEKAKQTLDSPLNKKRPLRDQLSLREKMIGDITIQKTKINMSIEKLQVHFRSGVTGQPDVVEGSKELMELLDALLVDINQQSKTLEAAVAQLDQLQQVSRRLGLTPSIRCVTCVPPAGSLASLLSPWG